MTARPKLRPAIAAAIFVASVAGGAYSQNAAAQIPTRTLGAPEFEFTEPMTRVTSVRALSDGRVIASDMGEGAVRLLDPRTQSATSIGRRGQGPGEYGIPGTLLAASGDTTWMVDMLGRRFLVIPPSGTAAPTTMPIVEGAVSNLMFMLPASADRDGRLYAESMSFGVQRGAQGGRAAVQLPESIPVIRIDRRRGATDTLIWVQQPRVQIEVAGAGRAGGNPQMRARGASPFGGRDAWAAGPDGSVAIVRRDGYRVEWIAPDGRRTVGPPIPFVQHRVTDADKEAVIKESQGAVVAMGGAVPANFDLRGFLESMDWPEFFPPFLGLVHIDPSGRVWIPVSPPRYGDDIIYDVVDRQGRLVERVKLPPKTRLVGFSGGALWSVRVDEDDLQYLQRRKP